MKMNGKTAAAAMSALALASMSAVPMAAMAAPETATESTDAEAVQVASQAVSTSSTIRMNRVEGTFSFDQQAVTPTNQITSVFAKAAATLCQAMPGYVSETTATSLVLSAPNNPEIVATIQDLASRDGNPGVVMACACATNAPGGGAVANADVEGASVASLAALAGAV